MQLTPDCRIGVTHTGGEGARLQSSCGNEGLVGRSWSLRSRVRGDRIVIAVPYSRGPDEMHPGQRVERTEVYTNAVLVRATDPLRVFSSPIDTRHTYSPWSLPR